MKDSQFHLLPLHMKLLESVALEGPLSRSRLAVLNNLSKMTVSNYVSDLIHQNWLEEVELPDVSPYSRGRRPTLLKLSSHSPRICGVLIMRSFCQVISADLSGHITNTLKYTFPNTLTAETLIRIVSKLIEKLSQSQPVPFIGCGISCIGPLNSNTGIILSPPNFWGIKHLNITEQISNLTGLHTVLINNISAGALAEKLYGCGKTYSDFAFLHFLEGIGMGFIINHELFDGFSGQSGELGHMSINFGGPLCDCGNHGCLELYANETAMNQKILSLKPYYPSSPLFSSNINHLNDIIEAANRNDAIALIVLDEFLTYISYGLINTINLLDFSNIIVGYHSTCKSNLVERVLHSKIQSHLINSEKTLHIMHARFENDSPLVGACAVIAKEFFSLNLPLK